MNEIAKSYEPKAVESKWYQAWLDADAFAGKRDENKDPFCIMIPPPNVTGMLHMGHILNNTLQDIFIRRARLEGKAALWYPGTDHAGIATQNMVEKKLRADGQTKYDLGREAFLEKVWEWREKHGGIILNQLRKLGASCDWNRTSFTLDESYSRAVLTAFVKLYNRGQIYRGKRMVNWCPVSQTALSDEEVKPVAQKGKLFKMRYELADREGEYVEIATTRPETIMGDTAVAVNPDDERYKHLVGQFAWRPFPRERIPIIGDEAVDIEFGTGVLKVTPAHDALDFEIGQRHNLPIIDVFNPDGTLNELAGEPFIGMDRFKARKVATKKLDELGLLIEEEDYENNVGFSERANVPIEPRLSEQWFLKYPKVEEAKEVVRSGLIRFHPQRWEKTYLHWLDNIRDWCISRQLWWGHRIPVWYKKGEDRTNPENWHVSVDGPDDPENWERDEDVLDTWASSNLWPFANFGWPNAEGEDAKDLAYFYPTSLLCTGFDIIFFWVARMIMAGLDLTGEDEGETSGEGLSLEEMAKRVPFRDVYITGLIRDEKGRKMSKSLGNSPDPLDLIEKFGADGLRFGIVNIAPSGQDILFSEARIQIGRNFCNKLWNACRFRQMSGPMQDNVSLEGMLERLDASKLDGFDQWILSRMISITESIENGFNTFEMHQMTHQLHNFFWGEFCDWYVEASKSKINDENLRNNCLTIQDLVIRQTLLLLHPVMPHITEELWHGLGYCEEGKFIQDSRILASRELCELIESKVGKLDESIAKATDGIVDFVSKGRALKASYNLGAKRDVSFFCTATAEQNETIANNLDTILRLLGAKNLSFCDDRPEGAPASVTPIGTLYLDLKSSIDIEAEKARLSKELEKLGKNIIAGEKKLTNEKFLNNAPPEIVEGAKANLAAFQSKKKEIEELLSGLG